MRKKLIEARKKNNLTQHEVAEKLGMLTTSYQNIEYGIRNTTTENWDTLEDLLGVPQRQLRETETYITNKSSTTQV